MKDSSQSFASVSNGDVLFAALFTNTRVTPKQRKDHALENSKNLLREVFTGFVQFFRPKIQGLSRTLLGNFKDFFSYPKSTISGLLCR